jgi:hypothetical protein
LRGCIGRDNPLSSVLVEINPKLPNYVLVAPEGIVFTVDRPKQADIRKHGIGDYTLMRADGQTLKRFTVTLNRNGNPNIVASTPDRLEGLSTLNLERLVRYYDRIVKIWPEQNKPVLQVLNEMERRKVVLASAEVR